MEIRDLYDENKVLTGEMIQKGESVPQGRYYITVVVLIQNSKGEFLLEKCSESKGGRWSLVGGHPKSGESSLDGIVMEIKEELGVDAPRENIELFKTIKTEDDFVDLYYTKADINIVNVVIQEEEVETAKWASKDEIEQLIVKGVFLTPHVEFWKMYLSRTD
ncbi:MAG TPA: hypothetical protein DEP72_01540 [Clostridiales bacterium]|nr:hypothetical protein [Clostridiales bacterium]